MCTVSWITEGEGYRLWFNRDEQYTRARAEAPFEWKTSEKEHSFLAPRDPVGGGSWIAVNTSGVLVALLNHYEAARVLPLGSRSRGELVVQLVQNSHFEGVLETAMQMKMHAYAAFHLLVLGNGKESMSTWDGKTLRPEILNRRFWTTSSRETDRVQAVRLEAYLKMMEGGGNPIESHRALHREYHSDDGAASICMRREDAQTVSHIEVAVGRDFVEMAYGERLEYGGFEQLKAIGLKRR